MSESRPEHLNVLCDVASWENRAKVLKIAFSDVETDAQLFGRLGREISKTPHYIYHSYSGSIRWYNTLAWLHRPEDKIRSSTARTCPLHCFRTPPNHLYRSHSIHPPITPPSPSAIFTTVRFARIPVQPAPQLHASNYPGSQGPKIVEEFNVI